MNYEKLADKATDIICRSSHVHCMHDSCDYCTEQLAEQLKHVDDLSEFIMWVTLFHSAHSIDTLIGIDKEAPCYAYKMLCGLFGLEPHYRQNGDVDMEYLLQAI